MTKPINDYTVDELSVKIQAIKAERERTANALKKYEEELERRKHEVPLGVPLELTEVNTDCFVLQTGNYPQHSKYVMPNSMVGNSLSAFGSLESAKKHAEMLLSWRKALVANSKGEPIDITVLLPLLKKGWVAMDKDGRWNWYKEKPYIEKFYFCWNTGSPAACIGGFNLKPADNWETSLMECGL